MTDESMFEELQRKLDEADSLSEEDREKLADKLGKFRGRCAEMKGNPAISPEEAAQHRETLRAAWLRILETSIKVGLAEGELLVKQADFAEALRTHTMMTLRMVHGMRKAVEDGTFTGTWEQREFLMETAEEVEENRESMLESLTAEDIRQLKDEGVL